MFKRSLTALSIASITLINPINAEEKEKGVYFVGAVGLGQMADIDIASSIGGGKFEFDSGFSGDIGVGYDFGSIRTELTYNSTNTDLITDLSTIDCFYHVYGERKDINPLIVEYEGDSWEDYPDPNFDPNKVDSDNKNTKDPRFDGPPNTFTK